MSGVRADGATRGDLAEATSLVVAGGVLVFMPLLAFLDRLGSFWVWVCAGGALGGAAIAGLGLRWFLVEGPPLVAMAPASEPLLTVGEAIALPASVRLVEAQTRLIAHAVRFLALALGALVAAVDLGPFRWVVIGLFFVSFVTDQLLLRPMRWIVDDTGLHRRGVFGTLDLPWSDVKGVWWRHYPDARKPPFPSGERVIFERREGGRDLEFVLHERAVGTAGHLFVRAFAPRVGERLRLLCPRRTERLNVDSPTLAQVLDSPPAEAAAPPETDGPRGAES